MCVCARACALSDCPGVGGYVPVCLEQNVDSLCKTESGIAGGVQHLVFLSWFYILEKSNPGVEQSLNPYYIWKAQRRGADHLL